MINKLFIKQIKGQDSTEVNTLTLLQNNGVEGDCHAKGDGRDVCFITQKTADYISAIKEDYPCVRKFSPNIILSSCESFSVGDSIKIGSAEIQVTSVGRECHKICDLCDCPLIGGIVFASVTHGGKISIGDTEIYD